MREIRVRLLGIPPFVADLIRCVVAPRLRGSGVLLTLVFAPVPVPDVVIAIESATFPAGLPAIIISRDFSVILGGDPPVTLTPESLAASLLDVL